jgi:rod shape-determining protein MreC
MRNIFLFIRRYRTFLAFLFLQAVALYFLFTYNRFHRAKFLGVANEVTGRINTQYNKVEDYFTLREENRRVHRLNDSLLNLLPHNFGRRDTSLAIMQDTLTYDTASRYRRYFSRPATVVYNTVNAQKNYLQLNRGASQGIRDNMAVVNSDGSAVGVVVNVSPNFSQVMSLVNVQSRVDAALKKTGEFGIVSWNGKDPRFVQLDRIPKSAPVVKGDSIITSGYNEFGFPRGFLVGTVEAAEVDKGSGFYKLTIKTAANFFNLQQVHVIENLERAEQAQLMIDTKKKTEQVKKTTR